MKLHSKILAGTAIGLLMASAPLAALPLQIPGPSEPWRTSRGPAGLPLILVQNEQPAEGGATEEELRRQQQQQQEAAPPAAEEAPPEQQAEEPAPEPAPPQAAEEPEPRAEEPAQAEQPAPEQEAPAQAEEPQAEEPARAEEPEAAPEEPERAEEPQQEEPARAEEPEAGPDKPATAEEPEAAPEQPERAEEPQQEEPARAEEPEAAPEEPERAEEPQQDEPARAEEPDAAPEEPATAEEPEAAPEQPERAEEPTQDEPARAEEPEAAPEEPATAEEPEAAPEQPERAEQPGDQPAPGTEAAEEDTGLPQNAAPVLDSAKEAPPAEGGQQRQQEQAQPAPEEAGPPPESDAAAQADVKIKREQIQTLITEEGRRIEQPQEARPVVPEGAEVVREVNDRFIVQFNNNYFVERPREERFYVDAEEVYYEELPRGRQREVVVRPDGTRIITIRNRFGDVVNRVKVLPDDREVVLVYVEDEYYEDVSDWRDPGADLPPLQLNIPVREYILDAERVEDPDAYYEFLEQPPVERVERTYSLTEVRRSARIRDKVRRIDLDTITFEFGSAEIAEDQIGKLEGVAEAMQKLLKKNPGETFLIEGHTDAVGSDVANLALSDQRAEAVATALSNVFEIPPENLATQGYGEQYLKIDTEERERENRRVAIRRITPLVAPVASNE